MYFNSVPCNNPGVQTAVVVGPPGSEIHTDGQGRVKVQFHWDRKGNYDENSSPWIRVMTPAGGREFGQIRLPRVKEEVVIVYADGNIDHPLILGAVHNVINMPPWALPSQEALSGMCSRELGGGARGNRLIVDDTRDKIQAQLQSDHQCSQLSLGHIVRIEGNAGRKDLRGEGWELRTDAHGVARAAKGLLLTTESRPAARGAIKDMDESLRRLVAAGEQHQALANLAQTNGAQDAANNQGDVAATLRSQNEAIKGAPVGKGAPSELAEPYLVIASPAGIVSTTAQSTHLASDLNTAVTAGKSVSISAGESFFASIRQSFQLYVQKAGLRLFAAAGDIDIKALTDNINLLSKLNITQTANRILINARQDIVINGGGSYVKLSETGIELGTSGTLVAHASTHEFAGANSMATPDLNTHVVDVAIKRDLVLEYVDADGNPLQHDPIQSHSWDGSVHDNILDESGKTTLTNISRGSFRSEQVNRK
jgi:type VI secretion system secreted protein VgrG